MPRVYQAWKGSNRFFLGGRLFFGPDWKSLLVTLVLIIAPGALFCVFVAGNLIGKLAGAAALLPVAILLILWDVALLLWTSARDPGIVPRNTAPPDPGDDPELGMQMQDAGAQQGPRLRLPRTKDVVINGIQVKVKYCDTCMLYRPPRCSHCSTCNNCVERFDHHCPWVGQCIGRRNYRYFFAFVVSTTVFCAFVFSMAALDIKVLMDNDYDHSPYARGRTVWQAMGKNPVAVVLMAYTFCFIWFTGGLTVFHLYLMSSNQTTYENYRYRYDDRINPYAKGRCYNIYEMLCAPIPPSRNDFRAAVQAAPNASAGPAPPMDIASPVQITMPTTAGRQDQSYHVGSGRLDFAAGPADYIAEPLHGPRTGIQAKPMNGHVDRDVDMAAYGDGVDGAPGGPGRPAGLDVPEPPEDGRIGSGSADEMGDGQDVLHRWRVDRLPQV
eukprot:SM000359S13448  [mRNA]  locus=s359:36741:39550:+ [translate_table: standard]